MSLRALLPVVIFLCLPLGCVEGPPPESGSEFTRDTLANGALHLRYGRLPLDGVPEAAPDLRIGSVEGQGEDVFGDIRGIDAAADGTVYVLDYLGPEIKAFDAEGAYLRTVASSGEGPGELSEANGMILKGDSILWVQDHRKWAMIGLSPAGEEMARHPMHVRSYGWIWSGTVDHSGRFWKSTSHSDDERPAYPPEEGLVEGSSRLYWKSFDPATEAVDSVSMGESAYRTFITRIGNGYSYRRIPFQPTTLTAVDPSGGFWTALSSDYRIARLSEAGDTVVLIEAAVDPLRVLEADRTAYVEGLVAFGEENRGPAEEVAALMPDTKPVLRALLPDEDGRLWVQREVEEGAAPVFDVFGRDGLHLGSVRMGFSFAEGRPLRIRNGYLYAVELDELEIPYVVRAPLPEGLLTR